MVKSYSKIVVASILISAAVPASAIWRPLASCVRNCFSYRKAAVVAGGSALLAKGAVDVYATTPGHDRWTRLDYACNRGNLWLVKVLNYLGEDINAPSNNHSDFTPLHIAAASGQKAVVRYLLQENVTVDKLTVDNRTALHAACEGGHEKEAIALLRYGAGINAVDCNGKTPLYYACMSGNGDLVEELLVRGADSSIRDNEGKTVSDIRYRRPRMNTILRSHELEKLNDPEAIC